MDLQRPLSRGGVSQERPVTRWRREESISRSGSLHDESVRPPIDDRPLSRRGTKGGSIHTGGSGPGAQNLILRPPSALGFGGRTGQFGNSVRQASAMTARHIARTPLSTQVNTRDRLVSQQGLRTATGVGGRGLRSRSVQDRRYYEGLLQLKSRELSSELATLRAQIADDTKEQATFGIYERRVKEMAAKLTELQGSLADYNLAVDRLSTGTEVAGVGAETAELAGSNDSEANALEAMFAERSRQQAMAAHLEQQIQKERNKAGDLVSGMEPAMRQGYQQLQEQNAALQAEMERLQRQLDDLATAKAALQDQICISPVKQEAVRLQGKLMELERRKEELEHEERERSTPEQERERLVVRVRQDNAEIATMERAMGELKEQTRQAQQIWEQVDQDVNESQSERHAKYLELRKREETIEAFLSTFEESHVEESQRLNGLEGDIVAALKAISQRLAMLPTQADYQDVEQGGAGPRRSGGGSGRRSQDTLTADHQHLTLYLNKLEVMETKVKTELVTLRERLVMMREEMTTLSDLDSLRENAEQRKAALLAEKEQLLSTSESEATATLLVRQKYQQLEKQLSENETHVQLGNLERKLAQLEQNNFGIREFIATRTSDADMEPVRKQATTLVHELNTSIIEGLKQSHYPGNSAY